MPGSTFGTLFCVTNFGESHGPAIGCVIDGCPPGLALGVDDIQPELDRRRPGTSRHVTQRNEADQVEILSGVYDGLTTGTPIALPDSMLPVLLPEVSDYSPQALDPNDETSDPIPTTRSRSTACRCARRRPRSSPGWRRRVLATAR